MATQSPDKYRLDWREVARVIMRDRGISSGYWKIGIGLKFGVTNVGPTEAEILPTGFVSVDAVVLTPTNGPGPLVFDAAELVAKKRTASGLRGSKTAAESAAPTRKRSPKKS